MSTSVETVLQEARGRVLDALLAWAAGPTPQRQFNLVEAFPAYGVASKLEGLQRQAVCADGFEDAVQVAKKEARAVRDGVQTWLEA